MTFPRIHDNGTSAGRLADAYFCAYQAVDAAIVALKQTAPNSRDYQNLTEFGQASQEHLVRLGKLNAVLDDLDRLAGHCERD